MVGTYGNGVIRMNMATGAQQIFQTDGMVSGSNAYCIYRDRKNGCGRLRWMEPTFSMKAAEVLAKSSRSSRLPSISREDPQGNVWFATQEAACGAWTRIMPGNSINMLRMILLRW